MTLIQGYLFRQIARPVVGACAALAGIGILSQSLDQLEVIVERGQSVWVMVKLTLLAVPQLLAVIIPIGLFVGAVPDLTWKMTSAPIVSPDGIAFQWEFAGTNTGAWSAETPATGKPLKFEGVSFVRVKDGKIVYQGDYYDALGFNKQLGW